MDMDRFIAEHVAKIVFENLIGTLEEAGFRNRPAIANGLELAAKRLRARDLAPANTVPC